MTSTSVQYTLYACMLQYTHTCSPNSVTILELVFLAATGLGPLLPGAGGRSLESGGRSDIGPTDFGLHK